mgnify:FL=1
MGADILKRFSFFKEVMEDTVDGLWEAGRVTEVSKGSILFRAKEQVDFVYFQLTGKSMLYNLTHTGQRKIVFIFGKGVLLNDHVINVHEASLFCETIEKSKIFAVPVQAFLEWMERDFALTKETMVTQEWKMWRLGHQLKNTTGSIYMERKLAAKLWKLARDFGRETPAGLEIDINMSVTFLADMLGAPRETTSRLCRTLTDHGLIQMKKKRIFITDPQKISHFYKTGEI